MQRIDVIFVMLVSLYHVCAIEYLKTEHLSKPRSLLASTAHGDCAYFGGGWDGYADPEIKVVEIFNTKTNEWSYGEISQYRYNLKAATVGSKVIFIGGKSVNSPGLSDVIDVYDTENDTLKVMHLKTELVSFEDEYDGPITTIMAGRQQMGVATLGPFLFIGGGYISEVAPIRVYAIPISTDRVDILHVPSGIWRFGRLSQSRFRLAAATIGDRVLFAGGKRQCKNDDPFEDCLSDVVDIYYPETNTWEVNHLSRARCDLVAATLGNKVFFIGGKELVVGAEYYNEQTSNVIDIYDVTTKLWTTTSMINAAVSRGTVSIGSSVITFGNDCMEVLNYFNGTTECLSYETKRNGGTAVVVNNLLLFGGGSFGADYFDTIAIFQDNSTSPEVSINLNISKFSNWPQGFDLEVPKDPVWCNNKVCDGICGCDQICIEHNYHCCGCDTGLCFSCQDGMDCQCIGTGEDFSCQCMTPDPCENCNGTCCEGKICIPPGYTCCSCNEDSCDYCAPDTACTTCQSRKVCAPIDAECCGCDESKCYFCPSNQTCSSLEVGLCIETGTQTDPSITSTTQFSEPDNLPIASTASVAFIPMYLLVLLVFNTFRTPIIYCQNLM